MPIFAPRLTEAQQRLQKLVRKRLFEPRFPTEPLPPTPTEPSAAAQVNRFGAIPPSPDELAPPYFPTAQPTPIPAETQRQFPTPAQQEAGEQAMEAEQRSVPGRAGMRFEEPFQGVERELERFKKRVIEPSAAVATEAFQVAIPGRQEIEQKAREYRREGLNQFEAARRAYTESDLPPGVKGAIELGVDPLNLMPGFGIVSAKVLPKVGEAMAAGGRFAGFAAQEAGRGVVQAVEKAAPYAQKLRTGEAGYLRIRKALPDADLFTIKGVDQAIKESNAAAISLRKSGATKEALDAVDENWDFLQEYRSQLVESGLEPEDFARYQEQLERLASADMEKRAGGGARAPKFGSPERAEYDNLRRQAGEQGIPILKSAEIRRRGRIKRDDARAEIAELEAKAEAALAGKEFTPPEVEMFFAEPDYAKPFPRPEPKQAGQMQAGMGIGEKPAQGTLLGEAPGVSREAVPLIDAEKIAAQQARRAEVARGQAEMLPAPKAVAEPPLTTEQLAQWDAFRLQSPEWVEADRIAVGKVNTPGWEDALRRRDSITNRLWDRFEQAGRVAPEAVAPAPVAKMLPAPKAGKTIPKYTEEEWAKFSPTQREAKQRAFINARPAAAKPVEALPGAAAPLKEKIKALEKQAYARGASAEARASTRKELAVTREKLASLEGKPPARAPTVEEGEAMLAKAQEAEGVVPPATKRVRAIQQKGQGAPESVTPQEAKEAHIELGAPDGPRPPKPLTAKGESSEDIVRQIAEKATQGERPDQTLLRLHEAAIATEARRNGIIVRDGNAKLRSLNVGVMRRGQLVPRTQDIPQLDELYNALHNPSKVVSGEIQVPKGYKAIYAELRDLTDWEQVARLDFDPNMATVEDYFYRGWKPPEGAFAGVSQGRPLVKTPAFKKPRIDATYREMRDAGFEPLFWNPYQQWALSRMQGTKYRGQMELVNFLKGMGDDFARPHVGGPIPKGWRVPEVGPAFEGKPFATLDAAGEPTTMYTRRWIVPDRVANSLENIYGKRPNLGKLTVGTKTIDPLSVIDWLTFVPKRAKLMFSLFQQVDFLTRAGAGSWTRMVDALFAGQPIPAIMALAKYPETAATIIRSNFSPGLRQSLARQLDSTVPLIKGRPGVNLKGISEAGLSTFDPAMFRWEEMDKVVREVVQEVGILGKGRNVLRAVGDLESAMRRGLFEGVYPAAMITDIRNNVAPMLSRMYPKLNDAQLNGTIARIINKKYSSIPASQSVLQNRVMRETLRRVFFSIGETEGLLRQAASTVVGPNKKFWAKHWLGAYLFVIATASAIHFASTGKPLPKERFTPVSKDKWGPLPIGYNTRFASPTIPFKGRGGTELTLDIVGQMDTALRVLNPGQFITARESIPIRATVNQVSGTDFFGTPINDVGPGGVVSRTTQLAQDLFSPIGAGGITSEVVRQKVPGAERVVSEGETRLGMVGLGVQATGLNLRAATREMRLASTHGPQAKEVLRSLSKLGLDLGYVTKRFDMQLGVKGEDIILTSEQREQLQWLTDDTIVKGLAASYLPAIQGLSKEAQIEMVKAGITKLRAQARSEFRLQLGQLSQTTAPPSSPQGPQPSKPSGMAPDWLIEQYRTKQPAGVR